MKKLGILVSGKGSNMTAIINACEEGYLPAKVEVVISSNPKAGALEIAKEFTSKAPKDMLKQMVILYSNLSLCNLKLEKLENAFKMADASIKIDPKFAKGWARRATALQAQGLLEDALTSLDEAIKIEPDVKAYKNVRKSVLRAVAKKKGGSGNKKNTV